ncbi:MAG: hypothetical protein KAI83_06590 [Thiomargarita sp.]|nr:hypothetical protein [Thiomargarita sp.]
MHGITGFEIPLSFDTELLSIVEKWWVSTSFLPTLLYYFTHVEKWWVSTSFLPTLLDYLTHVAM